MRFNWMTTAAMTFGVSALLPTFAKADVRHDDRGHDRVETRDVRHDDHNDHRNVRSTMVRNDHRDVRNDRVVRVEHDVRIERDIHIRPEVRIVPEVRYEPTIRYEPAVQYVNPNFDVEVTLNDVPANIVNAVTERACGRPIEAIQYVRRDGQLFYRFRIEGRPVDQNFRFSVDGRLLSVEDVG